MSLFQSTLPMRGATSFGQQRRVRVSISIHAPHAGSDTRLACFHIARANFNPRSPCGERPAVAGNLAGVSGISIHAPHAGSDTGPAISSTCSANFNPRSPCGERRHATGTMGLPGDFNPRSPCGERPRVAVDLADFLNFNPRSPCGERLGIWYFSISSLEFQSTLPMRGATIVFGHQQFPENFNPRSPCGERQSNKKH